jgi:hypothetical protein
MKVNVIDNKTTKTYSVPATWNELTLGRYMRIMKVLKDKEETSDIEKLVRIINCLSKIPKKHIYSLEVNSLKKLGKHITSFLESEPNDELQHFVTIEDIEYGFHPKLFDMTLGEFVDLETYMKDIDNNMHNIMSILYRPVTQKDEENKYLIEEYEPSEERANLFKKHLTVREFNGASVFFSDLERQLSNNLLRSSIQKLKKKKKKKT